MSTVELPDGRMVKVPEGQTFELHDIVTRLMVLPVGTTIQVPKSHEWFVLVMTVMPHCQYSPPGAGKRQPYLWGDIQISLGADSKAERTNALVLMDRYWSRYNLSPELPEAAAKIEQAQHALQSAPSIPDLGYAIEKALDAVKQYAAVATPVSTKPVQLKGPCSFTVEQVQCEGAAPPRFAELDVELTMLIKRPAGNATITLPR